MIMVFMKSESLVESSMLTELYNEAKDCLVSRAIDVSVYQSCNCGFDTLHLLSFYKWIRSGLESIQSRENNRVAT